MQRFWKHFWIKDQESKESNTEKERHPNLKRPHIMCGLCVFLFTIYSYFALCAVSTNTLNASGSFVASSANIFLFT